MTAVETGWGADGLHGTWTRLGPAVAERRIHPPGPERDTPDAWWWIALCAVGQTGRGVGRTITDIGTWIVDIDSRDVARQCAQAVREGGSPVQWFEALRVRRARRWCRWTGLLCGSLAFAAAAWWVDCNLSSGQCSALVGTAALGAVWWCWWFGQPWVEQDGIAPRMPAPLTMPSAPAMDVPAWRAPTDREFLIAASLVFHPLEEKVRSEEIAARMSASGGAWSGLTAKAVGNRLSAIGLRSVGINFVDETGTPRNRNGFTREAIERALAATLEPLPRG